MLHFLIRLFFSHGRVGLIFNSLTNKLLLFVFFKCKGSFAPKLK